MKKIAVRVHTEEIDKKEESNYFKEEVKLSHERILILDTETTTDEFQNLKFGSVLIIDKDKTEYRALFYNPEIMAKELLELKKFSRNNNIDLYSLEDFIDKIFYPEILDARTLCVGFNLPFDLTRIAFHYAEAKGNQKGWFSIQLSKNEFKPRIKIKHIDSTKSFIQFSNLRIKGRKINIFKGNFLDLKTPSVVFSDDKHITLKKAGEFFGCNVLKSEAKEHGKINEEYINYNLNDVLATYNLYQKIVEHLKIYQINIPINKIFSSASLGKYACDQMGIKPLSQINSSINGKIKGQVMTGYFGGRCELRLRKHPTEVSVLDFLSMYPSLTINMGLWDFITAKEIREEDVTEGVKHFLSNLSLDILRVKETWRWFNVLVELEPNEEILPVRSNYLPDSNVYNVGLNYLKHSNTFHYAFPDVIASVLLTGKVPKIKKAIQFIPIGKQESLKETDILGIKLDPSKDNFIKILIEKRQEFKKLRNSAKNKEDWLRFDGIQRALKILANSITYGIFIEVNAQDKESNLKVYAREEFFTRQKLEEEGKFFNPLIAVMQVAGARLLLAMAEIFLKNNNSTHIYMDTDSCFVPPNMVDGLRNLFKPLNPYNFDSDFFQIVEDKVMFYGISSKRYVLYRIINGEIKIIDYKLHGLGHLLSPYKKGVEWQKEVWKDILDFHYKKLSKKELIEKYSKFYAISKLTVSTPFIYRRFKNYNEGKPLSQQIKPYNFILIGQGNSEVKPISAHKDNPQSAVYEDFMDYKTGKVMKGSHYWMDLSDITMDYINHPESKFEGDEGWLKRRHIDGGEIRHIGKEVKNIEEQFLQLRTPIEYLDKEKAREKILNISSPEAKSRGVPKQTLSDIKKRLKENPEKFNWKSKPVRKLLD